jgi:serine/threonine protein kinase
MPEDDATKPLPEGFQTSYTVPLAGQLLKDRYLIQKELGRGGFGVVYLAYDTQLVSKPVVVKVLTLDPAQDAWVLKKFNQEMEALSRINHPGVIGSLDAGQTPDGKPFLVMQYIDGGSLRGEIREGGIEISRAASLIRQTAQALAAAHDKGILHRDIKPENILLQRASAGEEYAKLIDFGIAAIADSQFSGEDQKTKVAGSFAYMAPEQFQGKACAESDIYSLGVVAYELVTGRKPYPDATLFDLITQQQKGPTRPSQWRKDLPEAADQAILKALAYDPKSRFPGPREFGDQFFKACTGAKTEAMPVAPARTPDKPNLEVAHVLFLDIVGYSTLAMDQQTQYLGELNQIVRETAAFRAAEQAGHLIRLPTGDGMALTFFGDPIAPVECAVEIAVQLKSRPHLKLRTGIHTGPVYRVADINTNMNVSGGGINMAQRVMDAGDDGHILISSSVADTLRQLSAWRDYVQDLGEVAVKHGVMVRLYNLCTPQAGNPELPKKIAPAKAPEPPPAPVPPRRWGILGAAVLAVAVAGGGAWYYLTLPEQAIEPAFQRTMNYSITVQKFNGDKPDGPPLQTPTEMLYTSEHGIAINVSSPEAGHLYMLNRGPLNGKDSLIVVFPPMVAGATSSVAAGQTIRHPSDSTHYMRFDEERGTEKLYLVWSKSPIPEFEQAAAGKLGPVKNEMAVITDTAQVTAMGAILDQLTKSKEVVKDVEKKQTTVRSKETALAHLVNLEHY